jgi:hypothetical protein
MDLKQTQPRNRFRIVPTPDMQWLPEQLNIGHHTKPTSNQSTICENVCSTRQDHLPPGWLVQAERSLLAVRVLVRDILVKLFVHFQRIEQYFFN